MGALDAGHLQSSSLIEASKPLAPAVLRVGGTSADGAHYVLDYSLPAPPAEVPGDFPFPPVAFNFSLAHLEVLVNFSVQAGFELMLDINEIAGRVCHPSNCSGAWNTTALAAFLGHVRSQSRRVPIAIEMGNELNGILPPETSEADLAALHALHAWLRTVDLGEACIAAWNAGPRAAGVGLFVTELGSSAANDIAPPNQRSFLNGFFTIASIARLAAAGLSGASRIQLIGRGKPFDLLVFNDTTSAWEAAGDYWVTVLHQRLVGKGVLGAAMQQGDSDALVFAYCSAGRGGGVVVVAANTNAASSAIVSLTDAATGSALATLPRDEYILTACNNSTTAPVLNGKEGAPLMLLKTGALPPIPPRKVTLAGGNTLLTLPSLSFGYFVLPEAGAQACK